VVTYYKVASRFSSVNAYCRTWVSVGITVILARLNGLCMTGLATASAAEPRTIRIWVSFMFGQRGYDYGMSKMEQECQGN